MERPLLYGYDNYRAYLKDWYAWMKATNPGFSLRAFSMWTGLRSPNHLQLVFQGKRNLTKQTLPLFLRALKLKYREQRYFELLVNYNQTSDAASKARYLNELSAYLKKIGETLKHDQFEYLSKWYYPVIRELVATRDFKESRHWIAKRIGHGISPRQVDEAIGKLIRLGLLARDKNGRLVQGDAIITTGPESAESAVYLYHDQMIKMAHNALMEQPPSERNISGITFSCSKQDLPEISALIGDCRKQILNFLNKRDIRTEDEDVYQLNIQLFRVTGPERKEIS